MRRVDRALLAVLEGDRAAPIQEINGERAVHGRREGGTGGGGERRRARRLAVRILGNNNRTAVLRDDERVPRAVPGRVLRREISE